VSGSTVEEILALSPEILVTEATPSDRSCCGLSAQVKAHSHAGPSVKVEVIVHGGATRALDLGADDVLSFPFDEVEFAARIRARFRERQPQEELMTMLKYAVQREH
jgi:DNA-binding response OmpR family regulator